MISIIRHIRTEEAVLGRLYLNGAFVCHTLENVSKAIPCGIYNVQNSKSPKFKRELPLLWNDGVPASRGIRIHVGNTAASSSGCVLVGMGMDAKNSRLTESAMAEAMVTALCRNVKEVVISEL